MTAMIIVSARQWGSWSACLFGVKAGGANETAMLTAGAITGLVGCCVISRPIGGAFDRLGGSRGRTRRCWKLEREHKTGSLSVLAPSRVPEAVVTNLVQASR
jgi:hypothetical protein